MDKLGFLLENLLGGPALEAELDGHIRQATQRPILTGVRPLKAGPGLQSGTFALELTQMESLVPSPPALAIIVYVVNIVVFCNEDLTVRNINIMIYIFELFNGNDTACYFQISTQSKIHYNVFSTLSNTFHDNFSKIIVHLYIYQCKMHVHKSNK